MDARGMTDYACILPAGRSRLALDRAAHRQRVPGGPQAGVAITFDFHDYGPYRTRWQLDRNRYEDNRFWFDGSSHPETVI
jgi:hypothetical protein